MAPASDSGQDSDPHPHTAVPELDDLLEELRRRAGAARRGHQQIESLLDAVLAISADLELPEMLRRIVESACSLVDARYGALGVLGPDQTQLVEFITHGVTDQQREHIGDLPRGGGVLGLLIRDPQPLRIPDISQHPESLGFPPHHPPMRTLLGAPIRVRGTIYGNLYLSEKHSGSDFSPEDESMVAALAAAAGVALQNARLYEDIKVRREWSVAVSAVSQSLLESNDEVAALEALAQRVCGVAGAKACIVALDSEGSPPVITAAYTTGPDDAAVRDRVSAQGNDRVLGAQWIDVLAAERPLLLLPSGDERAPQAILEEARRLGGLSEAGPTALVPIKAGRNRIGVLVAVWGSSATDAANGSVDALAEFGQQVGIAVLASRMRRDRSTVLLLEDRERMARDMHDLVIQRLFATGLSLQFAQPLAQHPIVRSRIDEAITELDSTIADIREVIYQLHAMAQPVDFAQKVAVLVDNYSQTLGFVVELNTTSDPDALDPAIEMDVLAVIREALANVVRHARASAATVTLSLGPEVRVQIDDNGVGIGEVTHRSGLANLADRAEARSGRCEIIQRNPSGTRINWSVPLQRSTQSHSPSP